MMKQESSVHILESKKPAMRDVWTPPHFNVGAGVFTDGWCSDGR